MPIHNNPEFSSATTHFEPETETPVPMYHPTHADAAGPSEGSAPEEGPGDVVSAFGHGYDKPLPALPSRESHNHGIEEEPSNSPHSEESNVSPHFTGASAGYDKPLPALPSQESDNQGIEEELPNSSQSNVPPHFTGASTEAPHIQIHGTQEFHDSVNGALKKLKTVPDGRKLVSGFEGPSRKGNTITIKEDGQPYASARLSQAQRSKYGNPDKYQERQMASELAQKRGFGRKGKGASAEVGWSSTQALNLDSQGRPKIKEGRSTVDKPDEAHLALAHELIHARRIVKGTFTGGSGDRYDPSTPAGKEEQRAVGIGSRRNESRISENSIRRQFDQPLRTQYKGVEQPPEITRRTEPSSRRRDSLDSTE